MKKYIFFFSINFLVIIYISGCATVLSKLPDSTFNQENDSRSWGTVIDDSAIETISSVNIKKADPQLDKSHIVIVSYDGLVLIAGQTFTKDLKQLAEHTVKNTQNVKRTYNELQIAGPTTMLTRLSDSWITSKIKTAMLFRKNFQTGKFKVVTENGSVFLFGLVPQNEANVAVDIARNTFGVQRIVKIFD